MNNLQVSIAIPFFNSELFLENAIRSVINQTFTEWELILIDDGSTDNSLKIAKRYEKIDNRIKVVSDGENLGLAKRLNQTIKMAKGQFYARMDADDIMFSKRIEKQLDFMHANLNYKIIGSQAISINNSNIISGLRGSGLFSNSKYEIIQKGLYIHPTVFGLKSWFLEHLYDEDLKRCQDLDLWLRTYKKPLFGKLNEPLIFYREDDKTTLPRIKKAVYFSKIILNKNKTSFSFFERVFFLSKIKLKLVIYNTMAILGLIDLLLKSRSTKLDSSNNYDLELKKVLS